MGLQANDLVMGCLGIWLRTLALVHGQLAVAITLFGITLAVLLGSRLRKMFQDTKQRLLLSSEFLTLQMAGQERRCRWSEIRELQRQDVEDGGGIFVMYGDEQIFDLNGSWALPRETLLTLLAEYCHNGDAGKSLIVKGADLRFAPRTLKFAGAALIVTLLLPIIFALLAILVGCHRG